VGWLACYKGITSTKEPKRSDKKDTYRVDNIPIPMNSLREINTFHLREWTTKNYGGRDISNKFI
jgi:hypothetical protein